jgi:HEAT repeat protein
MSGVLISVCLSTLSTWILDTSVSRQSAALSRLLLNGGPDQQLRAVIDSRSLPYLPEEFAGALCDKLSSENPDLRRTAAQALGLPTRQTRTRTRKLICEALLRAYATEQDQEIRTCLLYSLSRYPRELEIHIDVFTKIVSDEKYFEKGYIATAIPKIVTQVGYSEGSLAAHVLVMIGPNAIPGVLSILQDGKTSPVSKHTVCAILISLGVHTHLITKDLLPFATHDDEVIRHSVLVILFKSTPSLSPSLRAAFSAALEDSDDNVRVAAAFALASQSPQNVTGLPVLAQVAAQPGGKTSYYALRMIGMLGTRASTLLPVLTSLLKSRDDNVREYAVIAIGAMGSLASSATTDIKPLLKDPSSHVRREAEKALKRIN